MSSGVTAPMTSCATQSDVLSVATKRPRSSASWYARPTTIHGMFMCAAHGMPSNVSNSTVSTNRWSRETNRSYESASTSTSYDVCRRSANGKAARAVMRTAIASAENVMSRRAPTVRSNAGYTGASASETRFDPARPSEKSNVPCVNLAASASSSGSPSTSAAGRPPQIALPTNNAPQTCHADNPNQSPSSVKHMRRSTERSTPRATARWPSSSSASSSSPFVVVVVPGWSSSAPRCFRCHAESSSSSLSAPLAVPFFVLACRLAPFS
mmetsp:Transcript_15067/g.60536  ORF Transcript_15067/g.60536 Transcript_15067/m.60536 type:complete len:268 (-) Transcript_15067:1227-2030(-)